VGERQAIKVAALQNDGHLERLGLKRIRAKNGLVLPADYRLPISTLNSRLHGCV
jgi:hypothetical protein